MSRELTKILDRMDDTRCVRIKDRPEIWQMNGYRREWNEYASEWVDDNSDWR